MYKTTGAYVIRSNVTASKVVYVDIPIDGMKWECPPHKFADEKFEVKITVSSG